MREKESSVRRRAPVDAEVGFAPGRATLTSRFVMRRASGTGVSAGADAALDRAASSSGTPLPAELQGRFEGSLGAGLGDVRVHTGSASADAASAVGARAYTTGNDIHFGAGQYDPSSAGGQHLIAHEVAHTVQQQGSAPTRQHKLEVSTPGDASERDADRAADAMVQGAPVGSVGRVDAQIAREPNQTPAPRASGWDGEMIVKQMAAQGGSNAEVAAAVRSGSRAVASLCGNLLDRVDATMQIEPARVPDRDHIVDVVLGVLLGVDDWGEPTSDQIATLVQIGAWCDAFPRSELARARLIKNATRQVGNQVDDTASFESVRQTRPGFTSCGDFAGPQASQAVSGAGMSLKTQIQIGKINKPGLAALRTMGAWTDGAPGLATRPRPGDIYVHGSVDGNGTVTFQHMGIIQSAEMKDGTQPEVWKTLDGGAGNDGNHVVAGNAGGTPNYDPTTNRLNGKNLLGWIDLSKVVE